MGFETVMRLLLLLRRDYGLRVPAGWAADYSFLTAGDAKLWTGYSGYTYLTRGRNWA